MPKNVLQVDFLVLGGGSAGYAAARTAVSLGLKTALVEGATVMGGLCILRGCMPTKALLESAHRNHQITQAGEFGIRAGVPKPDWKAIQKRKDRLIDDFATYRQQQLQSGKFRLIRGVASFVDDHTVQIRSGNGRSPKESLIGFRTAVVATGSVVARRGYPGLEETGYWTSDDAIRIDKPVKRLVVLGGRAVALEFAQYFAHLGVNVSLLQRSDRILPNQSPDVTGELTAALQADGIRIETGTELVRFEREGRHKVVVFRQQGKVRRIRCDQILNAMGREPNTRSLALDRAGVACEGLRIRAGATMQTSQPHIFAAGDVCGPYEVVHTAIAQGEMAARNAARLLSARKQRTRLEKMDYRLKTEVIFTDPEVASVGLNESEARAEGLEIETASYPFNDHGKSMIMGARFGFVKMVAARTTGQILGCQIVGPHASDLIHELIVALHVRMTVHEFKNIPHYHPTLAEILTYPAEEISDKIGGG